MRKSLLSAALLTGSLLVSAPAHAALLFGFFPGDDVTDWPQTLTIYNDFESNSGVTGSGFQYHGPTSDGARAAIPTSAVTGTKFLSVLGGGNATIALPANTIVFGFDWGSLDSYNLLTVNYNGGSSAQFIPGVSFPNLANGDQFLPNTNGLFIVAGSAGEIFDSINLTSRSNSFEIDNLAVVQSGVPEPSVWALMIAGFGLVGAAMRRKVKASIAYA